MSFSDPHIRGKPKCAIVIVFLLSYNLQFFFRNQSSILFLRSPVITVGLNRSNVFEASILLCLCHNADSPKTSKRATFFSCNTLSKFNLSRKNKIEFFRQSFDRDSFLIVENFFQTHMFPISAEKSKKW